MFKESDFVIVTVPLNNQTEGMIGKEEFDALKPTAHIIDVSRGGVIDHEALILALNEDQFAGAALDVFPEEPLPADSSLWQMPNVIITPHISARSDLVMERFWVFVRENLRRYVNGERMLNVVNIEKGY